MIIAREKKKNNIAEYLLYMWQIEDVIRSHYFDLEAIQNSVINKFDVTLEVRMEMKEWYRGLIASMKKEKLTEKGHLSFLQNEVNDLNNLHKRLLTVLQDKDYQDLYYQTKKNIDELINKSAGTIHNEVEACLTGLYGLLVLKLKHVKVSRETTEAMRSFSKLMAYLSQQYKLDQSGKLKLSGERDN